MRIVLGLVLCLGIAGCATLPEKFQPSLEEPYGTIKAGNGIFIESIDEKEIILLTDLDNEGKKLFSLLRKELQRRGVRIDNKLRLELFKTGVKEIEGLASFLKKQPRKFYKS